MPAKIEFKFNCPKCGQKILAQTEWIGRALNCPSCETRISIPSPTKKTSKTLPVQPAAQAPPAKRSPLKVETPAKPPKTSGKLSSEPAKATSIDKPKPAPAKLAQGQPAPGTAKVKDSPEIEPGPEQLRVAVLTPAIKLEIVRAVRKRIEDKSAWISGWGDGVPIYAAKGQGGETAAVDPKSPEATRFSLFGAFVLEMHLRRVIRTATGRTQFLDHEIREAVRELLLEKMSEEEREKAEDPLPENVRHSITHEECLATLDLLEERYAERVEQVRIEKSRKTLGNVRLPDLVKKLEKKAPVLAEDVATALYHELMEVRRRLERLETRIESGK